MEKVYDTQVKFGVTGHAKGMSVLDMEAGGGRFLSASMDGTLAMWDYGGMDRQLLPHRLLDPLNNSLPLRVAAHSPLSNNFILVASAGEGGGGNKMRLLKRSGSLHLDCPQGDPYVMDQRVTRGHTQGITGGCWSQMEEAKFFTCGLDGTVRTWNTDSCHLKNEQVLVVSKVVAHGASRSTHQGAVTSMALSSEDKLVIGGLRDGSIKAYNPAQPTRPVFAIKCGDGQVSSVTCNPFDENLFGAKLGNGVFIYDLRNTKSVLYQINFESLQESGNFEFTSAQSLLFGTSERTAKRENEKFVVKHSGKAQLWNFTSKNIIQEWNFDKVGVTQVAYQAKLDQIILGHSDGSLTGLFQSDVKERKGLLKALAKDPPKKEIVVDTSHLIVTPEPVPFLTNMVGPEQLDYNLAILEKKETTFSGDAVETPRKALEGRIAQSSITQRILMQHVPVIGRDEDPREALLRQADQIASSSPEEEEESKKRKKIN